MGDLLTDEYIQKIYNSVSTFYSKSTVSKATTDSEAERGEVRRGMKKQESRRTVELSAEIGDTLERLKSEFSELQQ